jgi:hypothetical protein
MRPNPYLERYSAGLWMAGTREIRARYATRCAHCGQSILVDDPMVGVFSIAVQKAWLHKRCIQELGVPSFVGKSG